jgi:predicted phosphoribosyltransferase
VNMFFLDRADAGRKLAQALIAYKGQSVVVYGLPRGGVVLAVEVAHILEAPLDLLVVRKIGHPRQPEYAIGAVAEDGYVVTNPDEVAILDKHWLEGTIAAELKEAQRRRKVFLQGRPSVAVKDKVAIIVDDGLATGLTMLAAIHEIRKRAPQKVVTAVPVAAADTVHKIRSEVDDLVVLYIPEWFGAVGAFYQYFPQISDDEVVMLMESAAPVPSHEVRNT